MGLPGVPLSPHFIKVLVMLVFALGIPAHVPFVIHGQTEKRAEAE